MFKWLNSLIEVGKKIEGVIKVGQLTLDTINYFFTELKERFKDVEKEEPTE